MKEKMKNVVKALTKIVLASAVVSAVFMMIRPMKVYAAYTITFRNYDGTVLQQSDYEEGDIPEYTGVTPTKPDGGDYSFTFAGWDSAPMPVTGPAIYTATFTRNSLNPVFVSANISAPRYIVKGKSYTITTTMIFDRELSTQAMKNYVSNYTVQLNAPAFMDDQLQADYSGRSFVFTKAINVPADTTATSYDFWVKYFGNEVGRVTIPITDTEPAGTNTVTTVDDGQGSGNTNEPPQNPSEPPEEPENEFEKAVNASNSQIETVLNQLNALIAAGKIAEANAIKAKGITIDAEILTCFGKGTYELIYKATQAGIPVTINFKYAGLKFATTIPAYTKLNPVTLCDKNGFCGFCNILYHYGGRLR